MSNPAKVQALHVIAGLAPADGGPSYTVPWLCEALGEAGVDVTLLTVTRGDEASGERVDGGFRRAGYPQTYADVPLLQDLRLSSGFDRALASAAPRADVVHDHGLWLAPNVQAGWVAQRLQKPLVLSPRGMLSPSALAFSKRRKQLFWRLAQGPVARRAACIHATSHAEYQEVRALGLPNPVAIVANGIDLPAACPERRASSAGSRTLLSLGRIHPKKGLASLVRAWAMVERGHPDWRLRIVGPAEDGHDVELRVLASSLGVSRLSIEEPVYGAEKQAEFRRADLFVLPTLSENFGVTVAEALAHGVPVISTTGAPWSGLRTEACGWWIEQGVEVLAAALGKAMVTPAAELAAMGARGRAWMERDFSWARVATDMADVYRWLAHGADTPACVLFD
ncbi:MAG TPA: glycosyltransferase [Caulobacteraceae bacterium]